VFREEACYSWAIAPRAASVEILSTVALHNCSKNRIWIGLQWAIDIERHSRSSEMAQFDMPCITSYCSLICRTCNNISILYATVCDLEMSFSFDKTVEITSHLRFSIHVYFINISSLILAVFSEVLGTEPLRTAEVTFTVTHGHWYWCHSIGHIRFSPVVTMTLSFPRYYQLFDHVTLNTPNVRIIYQLSRIL